MTNMSDVFVCRRETLTTTVDMTNIEYYIGGVIRHCNLDRWDLMKAPYCLNPLKDKMTQLISNHPIKSQRLFSHRFTDRQ